MVEKRSWIEIVLMPFTVTVVGVIGTYLVTQQQIKNSYLLTESQRQSAESLAKSDQQIKVLEIFGEKITSENIRERELAVRILRAVDPTLAEQIATAIAENSEENEQVRQVARKIVEEEIKKGTSFPVIGSFKRLSDARSFAISLASKNLPYDVEVYFSQRATDEKSYYAVTLGGNLSYRESSQRVEYAKEQGLANDAYVWVSETQHENLF